MNPCNNGGQTIGDGNKGGWEYSEMRTYVNSDIYNALPGILRYIIIDTTVVSSHGLSDSTNVTTTDKLYLLSTHEVWEDVDGSSGRGIDYTDTSYNNTRQLDYYKENGVTINDLSSCNTCNQSIAVKDYGSSDYKWWLRSSFSNNDAPFISVDDSGLFKVETSSNSIGVSPAFRIA